VCETVDNEIPTIPAMAESIKNVRKAALNFSHDPYDVNIFVAIMPFLGKTVKEAQAQYDKAQSRLSVQSNLAKLSRFTGVHLSKYPLEEPFKSSGHDDKAGAIVGSIQNMTLLLDEATELTTPEMFAKTSKGPFPIGTLDMAADVFQEWMEKTNCNGFNFL
jgi:alkanesulfonate monooxygenase SsuD/methylene tetrahydromethanopterin reductase-like flavin-dependent oxidoreductase (luciferase family)